MPFICMICGNPYVGYRCIYCVKENELIYSKSDKKRFWDKVDKSGDCWEWKGAKNPDGYGRFRLRSRLVQAHRFVYSLAYGNIPRGLCVCHHCDNPGCVNPNHLFLGTLVDNQRDSIAKERCSRGERHGRTRLVDNDVHEIRRLCSLGVTQTLLAKMWKLSRPQVSSIVNKVSWKHI